MSEPNPELAQQFEKEDAERKAEIASRRGGGGGERGGRGGGGKTWGSSGGATQTPATGANADPRKRGGSKERR